MVQYLQDGLGQQGQDPPLDAAGRDIDHEDIGRGLGGTAILREGERGRGEEGGIEGRREGQGGGRGEGEGEGMEE